MNIKLKFFREIKMDVINPKEGKKLVDSYPEPRDDFDRTAFQFECNYVKAEKAKMILFHIVGFFAVPVLLVLYLINSLRSKGGEHHEAVLLNEKFLAGMDYQDKLPPELSEEFKDMLVLDLMKYPDLLHGVLDGKSFKIWFQNAIRHPFRGFMNMHCLVHVGSMNRLLTQHTPRAMIVYLAELNYVSSLMTHLCEEKGCEYICFMHGDYCTSEKRAFVRFSRMYLWDEHYRTIFNWSRCPEEQYRFYHPKMYDLHLPDLGREPEYYFTYYFNGDDEGAPLVLNVLKKHIAQGKKCKVRPHPRYSNIDYLKSIFEPEGILVEVPLEMKLEVSIADSEHIAALSSTVLTQSYYAGKKVIVDDITNPFFHQYMKDGMFIVMNKPHKLLSEF